MTDESISIPNAPPIPGLIFRHFRGASDFPSIVDAITASAEVDKTERTPTVEELAIYYAPQANFDPEKDFVIVEINGEVIGYSRVHWNAEENDGLYLYMFYGCVVPKWRGKGVGHAILRWVEARSREIAAGHPAERPKFLETFATQYETAFTAMLKKSGFIPERYFHEMVRPTLEDIPNFPMPEGLEVRPALVEHYRSIWETSNEAFHDHWSFLPPTEDDYQIWLNSKSIFQPSLWQIAWEIASNKIAGQVRTFIDQAQNEKYNRKRGYTEFISVRRPWRRRGLARALIALSLRAQKEQGMSESALGVDTDNLSGATRVYADCGFCVVKTNIIYRKALQGI